MLSADKFESVASWAGQLNNRSQKKWGQCKIYISHTIEARPLRYWQVNYGSLTIDSWINQGWTNDIDFHNWFHSIPQYPLTRALSKTDRHSLGLSKPPIYKQYDPAGGSCDSDELVLLALLARRSVYSGFTPTLYLCVASRIWVGVAFDQRLKERRKLVVSLKPNKQAISETGKLVPTRYSLARR